jgi:hypothetical protein
MTTTQASVVVVALDGPTGGDRRTLSVQSWVVSSVRRVLPGRGLVCGWAIRRRLFTT